MKKASEIYENILAFFFPPKCSSCGEYLNSRAALCKKCRLLLENAKRTMPLENRDPNTRSCFCLYDYSDETVRKLIFNMKNKGDRDLCVFLAERLYENVKFRGLAKLVHVVTFAPRRASERRYAGHDQAELLAKALALKMQVPCETLIKRRGSSKKQRYLTGEQRRKNVKGKFVCASELFGKRILLIDDVITTGSTVSECARVLKAQGAEHVYVMGIAH